MAIFMVFLKWIDFNLFVKNHVVDVYLGLAALLFMLLGAWVFSEIKNKKSIVYSNTKPRNFKIDALSKREYEVLELMILGHTNQEIADILFVSIHTVNTQLSNIFVKFRRKNPHPSCIKGQRV